MRLERGWMPESKEIVCISLRLPWRHHCMLITASENNLARIRLSVCEWMPVVQRLLQTVSHAWRVCYRLVRIMMAAGERERERERERWVNGTHHSLAAASYTSLWQLYCKSMNGCLHVGTWQRRAAKVASTVFCKLSGQYESVGGNFRCSDWTSVSDAWFY